MIMIDTSKILFLSIQYLGGIKWSFDICAISSALRRSNIRTSSRAPPCRSAGVVAADPGFREEMGFLLFDRLPRGVRLNAPGKLFLSDVRRILQDVDEAKRRAERMPLAKRVRFESVLPLRYPGMD